MAPGNVASSGPGVGVFEPAFFFFFGAGAAVDGPAGAGDCLRLEPAAGDMGEGLEGPAGAGDCRPDGAGDFDPVLAGLGPREVREGEAARCATKEADGGAVDDFLFFPTGDLARGVGDDVSRSFRRCFSQGASFLSSSFGSSFFSSFFSSSSSDDESSESSMLSYSIAFLTILASFLSPLPLRSGVSSSDSSDIWGRSPTLAFARRYCLLRFS